MDLTEDQDEYHFYLSRNQEPGLGRLQNTIDSATSNIVSSPASLKSQHLASTDFSKGFAWNDPPLNVRQQSQSVARGDRSPSHNDFPASILANTTPKFAPTSGAQTSTWTKVFEDEHKSAYQESFGDHSSTTDQSRECSSGSAKSQSRSESSSNTTSLHSKKFTRAKHASTVKSRDLTSEIVTENMTKYQSTNVAAESRKLLQNWLHLPNRMDKMKQLPMVDCFEGLGDKPHDSTNPSRPDVIIPSSSQEVSTASHNVSAQPDTGKAIAFSRSQSTTNPLGPYQYQDIITAEQSKKSNLASKLASRQRSRISSEDLTQKSTDHATTKPVPRLPHLHTTSRDSEHTYCLLDDMSIRTTDVTSVANKKLPMFPPLCEPSPNVLGAGAPVVLDADRVIIEVLRRIAARMEASTSDERAPVMRVMETATREVLCICRELTGGKLMKII
jgi:hypothetical protein